MGYMADTLRFSNPISIFVPQLGFLKFLVDV